jgi:glycerol uptake operon antiterminator
MRELKEILRQNPIIAAARNEDLEKAMESSVEIIFLMFSSITDITHSRFVSYSREKLIFIHFDLIRGLSGEREAVQFLHQVTPYVGILSTKGSVIKAAIKADIQAIQRIFLIDTSSLNTSIEGVFSNEPTAVEIMPGIAPCIVPELRKRIPFPILLGGLIRSKKSIDAALEKGADGVSFSMPELWNYRPKGF